MRLATLLFGLPCVFLRKREECRDIHDTLKDISDGELVDKCNGSKDCIAVLVPNFLGTTADFKGNFICKKISELNTKKKIRLAVED